MQGNEKKWLQAALKGDSEAFSALVDMYAKPVYNLCYRMLGNSQDAEDAAQESFLRAFRALHRYDPHRKFATWLLSIAANYCIDQYRRVRPQQISIDDAPGEALHEKTLGPEKRLLLSEMQDEVQLLLNSLPARDRAAIILYYWHEYSYIEIARELSLTESALKARLHRARTKLATAWQEAQGQPVFASRRPREKAIT